MAKKVVKTKPKQKGNVQTLDGGEPVTPPKKPKQ